MTELAVDAEGIRQAGAEIARVGYDLAQLGSPLISILGRLGAACDDLGVAEAAADAQARWGQALDWASQGIGGLGLSLTTAAASYELAETLAGASFEALGAVPAAACVAESGRTEANPDLAVRSGTSASAASQRGLWTGVGDALTSGGLPVATARR